MRDSPLLPDFAASTRLYMRMLMSFLAASFAPEIYAGAQAGAAKLSPDDKSLAAERLRGIVLSHRDWVLADGARARLRTQWRELFMTFDAVICPVMPMSLPSSVSSGPPELPGLIAASVWMEFA